MFLAFVTGQDAALALAHEVEEVLYLGQVAVFGFKLHQRIGARDAGLPHRAVGLLEGGKQFH